MIRIQERKNRIKRKGPGRIGAALLSAALVFSGFFGSSGDRAEAAAGAAPVGGFTLNAGETGGTGEGTSGEAGSDSSGNSGRSGSDSDGSAASRFSFDALKLTRKAVTVLFSGGSDIRYFYLLVKEAGQDAPSAEEIKRDGIRNMDGFISMAPLALDVEYVFYLTAEDKNGKLGEVISKRGATIGSKGIEVMGHVYCSLQARDEIDDFTNWTEQITISTGTDQNVEKVEYIIADRFLSSEGLIESVASDAEDVNTSAGPSSIQISKWTEYDPKTKPGLVKDMLNYIYVRVTDTEGNRTYISSRGIWEDETVPMALSVEAKADETSAVVTVTGNDDESGLKKYYLLLRDPVDLSPVLPDTVKDKGRSSDDGVFAFSGLRQQTRYELYAVVEDQAGNLSPVREGMVTTEGEQAASAVRPSGDTSGNPGPDSNIAKRTDGQTLEDLPVEETVEELVPFIVSSPNRDYPELGGVTGWENIGTVAEQCMEPADIYIDMNGGAVVPGDVLKKVSGRNVRLHFIMDDTYIWVVDGQSVPLDPPGTDLRISRNKGRIPAKLVNDLAGVYPREEFSVDHVGSFIFDLSMEMRLGEENAGKKAHIYRYLLNDYRLESVAEVDIDHAGSATFVLPDASDFLVVVGNAAEGVVPQVEPSGGEPADKSTFSDFANTDSGSENWWIWIVVILGVLLCGYIAFLPQGKRKNDDDYRDR